MSDFPELGILLSIVLSIFIKTSSKEPKVSLINADEIICEAVGDINHSYLSPLIKLI